jgi:hypothetical protein
MGQLKTTPIRNHRGAEPLIREFTNTVNAVSGYSELALHEIVRPHSAGEWLEKIKNHTKQAVSLVRWLTVLSSGAKRAPSDEC